MRSTAPSPFQVERTADGTFHFHIGDTTVASYVTQPPTAQLESPRPLLHPLRSLAGEVVTLSRPGDHLWHTGLSWALPNVGDDNFWGGPTYIRDQGYVQRANNGRQENIEITTADASTDGITLTHRLDWLTELGEVLFDEERTLTVRARMDAGAPAWALIFSTAMRNVSGQDIPFGSPSTAGRDNAGYGGLFWRGPDSWKNGVIHTVAGPAGEELRGSRAPWMAYTGHPRSGSSTSVVMVDDSQNPTYPTEWFVRTEEYAGLCPAPFFSDELIVKADDTLRLRYAVIIGDSDSGSGSEGSDVAQWAEWGRQLLGASR
ncbi:MAG TPA: PmoA family protein [Glaciihabitans sp.]|nr:PmoA family protein [Glaciihabitans sp.]